MNSPYAEAYLQQMNPIVARSYYIEQNGLRTNYSLTSEHQKIICVMIMIALACYVIGFAIIMIRQVIRDTEQRDLNDGCDCVKFNGEHCDDAQCLEEMGDEISINELSNSTCPVLSAFKNQKNQQPIDISVNMDGTYCRENFIDKLKGPCKQTNNVDRKENKENESIKLIENFLNDKNSSIKRSSLKQTIKLSKSIKKECDKSIQMFNNECNMSLYRNLNSSNMNFSLSNLNNNNLSSFNYSQSLNDLTSIDDISNDFKLSIEPNASLNNQNLVNKRNKNEIQYSTKYEKNQITKNNKIEIENNKEWLRLDSDRTQDSNRIQINNRIEEIRQILDRKQNNKRNSLMNDFVFNGQLHHQQTKLNDPINLMIENKINFKQTEIHTNLTSKQQESKLFDKVKSFVFDYPKQKKLKSIEHL